MKKINKIKRIFKRIPKKYYFYACLILLMVPCYISFFTYAKYVFNNVYDNYLLSQEFYFESPQLDGQTHNTYDWDGTSTYSLVFEIRNYIDLLRWTDENVPYTVSVSCNPSITGSVSCTSSNGTIIYNSTAGTSNNIIVNMNNTAALSFKDNDYVDMNVSVTSTSPYRKTLDIDFKIYVKTQKVTYKISDATNQEYLEVTIANQSLTSGNITVAWDYTKIAVDNLRKVVANATTGTYISNNITYVNSFTTDIPAKASYLVRFYKSDVSKDYTYPGGTETSVITLTEN